MNPEARRPFKVAAVQATSIYLDLRAGVEKACRLTVEAAAGGAKLVVFPEAFLPGYPLWVWYVPAGDTATLRAAYAELLDNSVAVSDAAARAAAVPDIAVEALCETARETGVCISIGINERNVEASGTTLYNSNLVIGPDGRVLGCHRKLVPTGGERLVHAQGDGGSLETYELPFGRLGGLICWENYMPLARYAMYAWGTQIYVAPTWDRGEPWLSTLRHIAKEGRVYVVGCGMAVRKSDLPDRFAFKGKYLANAPEWLNAGDSVIVDPDGKVLAGPAHECEEILYAEVDPDKLTGPRFQLDVAGHYARPDVFEFAVRKDIRPVARILRDPNRGSQDREATAGPP